MSVLDRDGVRIYYEVHGSGPAILLSHGHTATSAMWRGQVDALSRRNTLITWDLRGHGRSDSPDDPAAYGTATTLGDMAALLDAVGAPQAIVGGQSLGGYLSLLFNAKHPERVRALLLLATGPGFRKDEARANWNARALATAKGFEESGDEQVGKLDPRMTGGTHRSARGLALASRGFFTQDDATAIDSLPGICVPTLIVVGADDAPFLPSADVMAARIPGARKVVIPAAGHRANVDQPEAFNRVAAEFIDSLG
jgi:pimeloyl-ACP methyl ester carboxylesterase